MSQTVTMARAIADFSGDAAKRQLSFKKNDLIKVTHQYENGWWAGELGGKIGYIPATYVKVEGSQSSPATSAPAPARSPLTSSGSLLNKPAPGQGAPPTNGGPKPVTPGSKALPPKPSPATAPPTSTPPSRNIPPATPPKPAPVTSTPPPRNVPPATPPKPAPVTSTPQPRNIPPATPPTKPMPSTPASHKLVAGAAGADVNEADFMELDSLIRSLQDEVLDLKKLL